MAEEPRRFDLLDKAGLALLGFAAGLWLGAERRQAAPAPFGEKQAADEPKTVQALRAAEPGRGRDATSPFAIPWRGWRDIMVRTYRQIGEDRLLAVAAGVVFLGLLALFPAITAIVSLYGLFADPATVNDHLQALSGALPRGAYSIIHDQVVRVTANSDGKLTLGAVFGLLIALWSANAGVKAVIDSLNVVYEQKEKRGFFRLNGISLTLTLGAVLFVLGALALVVIFPLAMEGLGLNGQTEGLVAWARWPGFMAVMLVALGLLYRYGPDRRGARLQWVSVGSVFAAVTWALGSGGFSLYLANFADYDATYGTLGAAIGLMMWMWLTTIVVLVGAELNAEIEHQTAEDTTVGDEKPLGARGATMADTVGPAT